MRQFLEILYCQSPNRPRDKLQKEVDYVGNDARNKKVCQWPSV